MTIDDAPTRARPDGASWVGGLQVVCNAIGKTYLSQVFFTDLVVIGITSIWGADHADSADVKDERHEQFAEVCKTMDQLATEEYRGTVAEIKAFEERATTRRRNTQQEAMDA